MKISVVIPTYNRQEALSRYLASLSDQDIAHDLYWVIVVDDGSTDRTAEMLRGLQPGYELVTIVQRENRGQAAARNIGAPAIAGSCPRAHSCAPSTVAICRMHPELRPGLSMIEDSRLIIYIMMCSSHNLALDLINKRC